MLFYLLRLRTLNLALLQSDGDSCSPVRPALFIPVDDRSEVLVQLLAHFREEGVEELFGGQTSLQRQPQGGWVMEGGASC